MASQRVPTPVRTLADDEVASSGEEIALDSEEDNVSDAVPGKDEIEQELERLVFGDATGFKDEIKGFKNALAYGHDVDEEVKKDNEDDQLAEIDDADLFFLDSGVPNAKNQTITNTHLTRDDDDLVSFRDPPAWEDSDDDRTMVSLMSVPRLRKLRVFDGEDVISGKEYTRRLRRHYEVLNPAPTWADRAGSGDARKRQRLSGTAGSSDEELSSSDEMDVEDSDISAQPLAQLLRSNEMLTRPSQRHNKRLRLRPEVVAIERMKDIGPTQPSAINCLSIHPSLPIILSSGTSSTLYLHHLMPRPVPPDPQNPLITSLHLKHTPLSTTAFSAGAIADATTGPQIYLSSRRRYFHIWDLPSGSIRKVTRVYGQQDTQRSMETLKPSPCGRYVALLGSTRKGGGVINVLDARTLQWMAQVRVESRKGLADFAWWGDGRGLCIVGRGGEVSEWSSEESRIIARWEDEGAVGTTTLVLGGRVANADQKSASLPLGPDRWVVIGSTSGIVNVYDRGAWTSPPPAKPKPTKTFDHLTTPISNLAFSPCGQLLAMSSRWKRDALRLVHLPSCTVYRNWPTSKTPLGRISAVALGEYVSGVDGAEKSLVLCVGNEAGTLRAWEITG